MVGSEGRVFYGHTFTAPCSNDLWREDTHDYVDCVGTLTFGPDDREAPCDTCGARCGRLVAFGLPSGAPYPSETPSFFQGVSGV